MFVLEEEEKPISYGSNRESCIRWSEYLESNAGGTSVRRVAEALDLARSTVQIMRNILRYYPASFNLCRNYSTCDFETDIRSHCSFLLV
ncbi:hypothetical protein TNCV_2299031 [Trichonephila clavipes]|nr:hypothetical protein TNCV_2299031 [Trichonephila clavipes]